MTATVHQPRPVVDEATVHEFVTTGSVIVRGLFSDEEVAVIERGIERTLADPSPRFKVASSATDPGSFVEDFCNWQRIEEFRQIAFTSRAADVAAALTGSRQVRLFHDHVLVKEPGTRQETPWHQDQPYYNVDGFANCSMWAPVDPVPAKSTLEFLSGSHRQGWLMPRSFMTNEAKWFPEGSLGDDMVHAPRRWVTSPQFEGLEDELPAGSPMSHELFPVLRETRPPTQ